MEKLLDRAAVCFDDPANRSFSIFRSEYPGSDASFMVAELRAGALEGVSGLARYRPEFAEV